MRPTHYVPMLPCFGVLLWGIWLGRLLPARPWTPWPAPWLWAGRHSLAIYMLHQPLLGFLYGVKQLAG